MFVGMFLVLFLVLTGASTRLIDSGKSLYDRIRLFSAILDKINTEYVEEKDAQELIDNAINGMVSNLDPHTTYLPPSYFERWNQDYEGYSGIGITFDIIRDKITIMSVINKGPSDQVGLMTGDRIVAIDGESAVGIKRDAVPLKLMGPKGTKVEVTIERSGWPIPKNYVITRDEIHVQSVPYIFMIQSGVGYIRIIRFSATTAQEVQEGLQKLESQGLKKLILDLRGNGGGYLEAAVETADHFLNGGKRIVYTKGRVRQSFREFFSTNGTTYPLLPVIVLIDRASASASEVLAGALQDWDRALIVGETSFGKGLVQSQYRFGDGSALLMTTARYYTPTGRLIQRSYDDKSFEEYYTEALSDSLRRLWEKDASRPTYKTQILRRKVLGGGGITPDIFLTASTSNLSEVAREIFFSPQRLLFTFAEDYVKSHPELKTDFNDFLKNYKPNANILRQFHGYIRELKHEITEKEFVQNREDIRFLLKRTIAEVLWGDEAQYKVYMLRDQELLESLAYLLQAEELLTRAYRSPKR